MPTVPVPRPFLISLLSAVFFLSGCSSVIFQVVWQRLLTVYYGVGSVSMALIVSIYMCGLGFGALAGGILAERAVKKLRLYFIIELLIGFFGFISIPFLNFLGRVTAHSDYFWTACSIFLFLCIPTLLMGMTLPLLVKIFNRSLQNYFETVSRLYFLNTIGAAIGAFLSSFYVISFFGLDTAVYVAVIINVILAGVILFADTRIQEDAAAIVAPDNQPQNMAKPLTWGYGVVFVSGFLAIGYEIIWFRIIGVLAKTTSYTFSGVLGVYLLGIAAGSLCIRYYLKKNASSNRASLFFFLQFLIGISATVIVIGYFQLTQHIPPLKAFTAASFRQGYPFDISFFTFNVICWPFIFVFIPTFFMGAGFPLIAMLTLAEQRKEGRMIGRVYFWNIAGNIFGGLVTGFVLLETLGTEVTLLMFSVIGILWGLGVADIQGKKFGFTRRLAVVAILLCFSVAAFPRKHELYEMIHFANGNPKPEKISTHEGKESVVVTYEEQGRLGNYINGSFHGGRPGYHFFQKTIEAASFAGDPKKVLVIGFGTGSIVEMALKIPEAESVTVIELDRTLMKNLTKFSFFQDIIRDPRLKIIIDDGRRFLLRSDETFDLVLTATLQSTTAYSNNLYSLEFFQLVRDRLNPGGIFMTWTPESVVTPNTITAAFDYSRAYGSFYIASNQPLVFNEDRKSKMFGQLSVMDRGILLMLSNMTVDEAKDNAGIYLGIGRHSREIPVNRDLKPVTEYFLRSVDINR